MDPASVTFRGEIYPPPSKTPEKKSKKTGKADPDTGSTGRTCKEHTFLTDVADVRTMEHGLLQLLEDFHCGKLQAFKHMSGGSMTFEKMDQIREQQEQLARLHFEMDIQQDMQRRDTDEGRKAANEKLKKLVDKLHSISSSIQSLPKNGGHR
uniref:Coiled-coil domain-containing protein 28B-like isoform X2 n=1 Tax=Crassostrea virginica TaxID=6565 RepID=A0A8B8EBP5_CRAVI|nr:coiled-coil domain-containing protein 28B-like isoform X2 [Crassostrea virginica]